MVRRRWASAAARFRGAVAIAACVSMLVLLALPSLALTADAAPSPDPSCASESTSRSTEGTTQASLEIVNNSAEAVQAFWLDYSGKRVLYQQVAPGARAVQATWLTHPWVIASLQGACYRLIVMTATQQTVSVDPAAAPPATTAPTPGAATAPAAAGTSAAAAPPAGTAPTGGATPPASGGATGGCTLTAQTPRGTVDLRTTPILHTTSSDHLVFAASAPTAQDTVTVDVDMLGFPVFAVAASGSGGTAVSSGTYPFDVATVAPYGRSAEITAISSGPSGTCTISFQLVIDDVNALSTPLGIAATAGTGLGVAFLAAGLLLPLAVAPMLMVLGLMLLGAGGGTLLQQLALPVDPSLGVSAMAASLPNPIDVLRDPTTIGVAILGAIVVAILMPFPSELFNRTVEQNREEIRGWFGRIPGLRRLARPDASPAASPPAWQRGLLGGVLSLAIAGLLSAALDPGFGPNAHTSLAWLASALAVWMVLNTSNLPRRAVQRRLNRDRGQVSMIVEALPIAVLGVVISRVVGYEPGYLYGVVMVWAFVHELNERVEARTVERGTWWMLALSVGAWLMLNAARAGTNEGSIPGLLLTTVLSAVTVAGVEAVVFALLPLGSMAGATLFRASRLRWGVLYAAGLLAFILVILNPANGFARAPEQVSFVTAFGLFVAFALFSAAFWAFFQVRHRSAPRPASA
jgi:hypothetical protein